MEEFLYLLQREIRNIGCDPKVEALLVQALDMGLEPEDFLVSFDHLFNREYSKDVVYPEVREDARKKNVLWLHLSRGGIYDLLPEGLFFQPEGKSRVFGAGDMAADHKRNKKKEEEIRRFFQPFEHEFLRQRTDIERTEVELLEGMQTGMLNDYFLRFWDISPDIPRAFVAPVLLLLPYAHRIAGNLTLMGKALEQLLQEPVVASIRPASVAEPSPTAFPGLGGAALGLDLVCEGPFREEYEGIGWTIGPLNHSSPADYLAGGSRFTLMETFTRFFVPAGMDTHLVIHVHPQRMVLGDQQSSVLGYSCMLTT